jgi:tRNA 2-thiouridine synthesizing protein A
MNHELDLSDYNCPLPVLKTKKYFSVIGIGDIVKIITTDPASKVDLSDFCLRTGHVLLEQFEENKKIYTVIKKNDLNNR